MKKIFTLFILLVPAVLCHAQDLTFSQFYEQPLLRNPALAGVFTGDLRVSIAYRDQWASVTTPFRTAAMSIEYKIPFNKESDFLTLGAQMTMDGAGDIRLKRTQILPAVNFHKLLDGEHNTYLSVAFMGGPVSSQFDPSQLVFADQYQGGSYNSTNATGQLIKSSGYSYWDAATGISISSELSNQGRFYFGLGMAHFTKPVVKSTTGADETLLSPKWTLNAGLNSPMGERARIIAFVDYFAQNGNRQLLGGALYGMDVKQNNDQDPITFYLGSFVRWGDALIPVIKMDFNSISIGMSYDVNISALKAVSNSQGGFEFTASYKGFLKIRNSTLDKVKCVKF